MNLNKKKKRNMQDFWKKEEESKHSEIEYIIAIKQHKKYVIYACRFWETWKNEWNKWVHMPYSKQVKNEK